jgi:hypothetical protein
MPLVTIFDGCCRERRQGSCARIWGTPATTNVSYLYLVDFGSFRRTMQTYGPISEGVTGSAGCGGRLISVGVVMLRLNRGILRQFRGSLEGGCLGVKQVMLEKLKGRVA